MMQRIRGRRVLLLIASALPLLAEDDVTISPIATTYDQNQQQEHHFIETDPLVIRSNSLPLFNSLLTEEASTSTAYIAPYEHDYNFFDCSSCLYETTQQSQIACTLFRNDTPHKWIYPSIVQFDVCPIIQQHQSRSQYLDRSLCRFTNNYSNEAILVENNVSNLQKYSKTNEILPTTFTQGSVGTIIVDNSITDHSQHQQNLDETSKMSIASSGSISTENTKSDKKDAQPAKRVEVDYASKSAGALILEQSDNFQGTSNLLMKDNDRYAIVPCEEDTKFVVLGLSEDILVKSVVLANYERFSSHTKDFNIAGRSTTVGEWNDLGTYTAEALVNKQVFHLTTPTWARYLKIQFLTHYGSEDYCTMTQISVHGSTMLQGFHEQWGDDEEKKKSISNEAINVDDDKKRKISDNDNLVVKSNQIHDESSLVENKNVDDRSTNMFVNDEVCDFDQYINDVFNFCPILGLLDIEKSVLLLSLSKAVSSLNELEIGQLEATQYTESLTSTENHGKENVECTTVNVNCAGNSHVRSEIDSDDNDDGKPVVERIKQLIRTTADAVDEFGNTLRHRGSTTSKSSEEIPINKHTDVEPSRKKDNVALVESDNIESIGSTIIHDMKNGVKTESKQVLIDKTKLDVGTPHVEVGLDGIHDVDEDDNSFNNEKLSGALKRLPSASCLESLDFSKFKSDISAARNGGVGASGTSLPGNAMEPIFKKLTDEIKSLQANMGVHDQFTKKVVMCYQSVMLELILEMETTRLQQDARISKLENNNSKAKSWMNLLQIFKSGSFINPVENIVQSTVESAINPFLSKVMSFIYSACSLILTFTTFVIFDRVCLVALAVRWSFCIFLCFYILYKMGLRIVWRLPSKRQPSNPTPFNEGYEYALSSDATIAKVESLGMNDRYATNQTIAKNQSHEKVHDKCIEQPCITSPETPEVIKTEKLHSTSVEQQCMNSPDTPQLKKTDYSNETT